MLPRFPKSSKSSEFMPVVPGTTRSQFDQRTDAPAIRPDLRYNELMLQPGLLILVLAASAFAAPPTFECAGEGGKKYTLTLTDSERTLLVQTKEGKRPYALSDPNLGRKLPSGSPVYYVGTLPNGKTPFSKFQMGTMVRTLFFQSGGRPSVSLDIVLDNIQIPKLKCPVSSHSLPIVPLVDKMDSPARFAEPLLFWGGKIDQAGKLDPLSLLALEATVLQFFNWPKAPEPGRIDTFLKIAGPALLKIPPVAVETLRSRFTKKEKDFLDLLLGTLRYKYHPESQRFAHWVTDGLERNDLEQVRGGFAALFRSPSFKTADLRGFFQDEVKKRLPTISAYELATLTEGFSPEQEAFVLNSWDADRKAEYLPVKANHALLKAMENNLTRPLVPAEDGHRSQFSEFVLALSKLVQSPSVTEAGLRSYFKLRLLPLVDRLNSREKKNLSTALGEGGTAALTELRALAQK